MAKLISWFSTDAASNFTYLLLCLVFLVCALRPGSQKREFTSLGNDSLARDLTRPRFDLRVLVAGYCMLPSVCSE
jgi:hypothetical protein